jgi:antitoxin VapB
MGIFIKNPEVERKARELARLEGKTLTAVIGEALDEKLERRPRSKRRRPTLEEMQEATERFRKAVGLDKRKVNVTKADFDALWDLPGLEPKDGDH